MTTTALITGANKGIGFEAARQLSARGITVIVAARDEARGQAAAKELGQPFVRLDVTDAASVRAAADWVEQEFGRLDILVNNAGVSVPLEQGLPSATTLETITRIYQTNVFGVITVTNALLPLLRKSPAGRIVNVSSEMGSMTHALLEDHPIWPINNLPYNSSKAALNMVTVAYAKELWDSTVKVNATDPGWCSTDINNHTGYRTAAQGAEIIVELATTGPDGPTGSFVYHDGPLPW